MKIIRVLIPEPRGKLEKIRDGDPVRADELYKLLQYNGFLINAFDVHEKEHNGCVCCKKITRNIIAT